MVRLPLTGAALALSLILSACGGSENAGSGPALGSGDGPTRDGEVIQETLASAVDGEDIAITIIEPTTFTEGASYPLILHSHGYGGSRQTTRPESGVMRRLLDAGYGVISIDERGHGESGGTIRILDPAREGQDLLQVLDWAEENLEWLAYDPAGQDTGFGRGNPIVGAIGGSYGGGYQLLIYAIDAKHRLDAIAPDITWHDLRYSLFSGGVFKTFWATLLSGLGNAPPNTQDTQVNQGLAEGLTMNTLSQENLDLLYQNSPASHCNGENAFTAGGALTPIDAFITQSALDTLFNFNDAHDNFDCLRAQGGDVRLFTKAAGHGIDSGDGSDACGDINRADATFAWFEDKLRGVSGAADFIPEVCMMLGTAAGDAIEPADVPLGGTSVTIDQQMVTATAAGLMPTAVPVFTAPAGGAVLAGVPTAELEILDPLLGADGVGDPIVFLALGVPDGNGGFTVFQNQYRPVRGYGSMSIELNGVFARLAEGDEVNLLIYPAVADQYASSASTVPATVTVDATIGLPLTGN